MTKAPLKICTQCGHGSPIRVKECPQCGAFFQRARAELPPELVADVTGETMDRKTVYVAERDFSHSFGGTTVQFSEGRPITDRELIAGLLAVSAPIKALAEGTKVARCPHCHQAFPLTEGTEH